MSGLTIAPRAPSLERAIGERRDIRVPISSSTPRAPTSRARSRRPSTSSTPPMRGRRRRRRDRTSAASAAGRRSSRTSRALAHAALIARLRRRLVPRASVERDARARALVTVSGADRDGVREIEIGTTIGELAADAGAGRRPDDRQAVLLGGYFGGWLSAERGWDVPLDPVDPP